MDLLAYTHVDFNYLETAANILIVPARQNKFNQENVSTMIHFVGLLCNENKLSIQWVLHWKSILVSTNW